MHIARRAQWDDKRVRISLGLQSDGIRVTSPLRMRLLHPPTPRIGGWVALIRPTVGGCERGPRALALQRVDLPGALAVVFGSNRQAEGRANKNE